MHPCPRRPDKIGVALLNLYRVRVDWIFWSSFFGESPLKCLSSRFTYNILDVQVYALLFCRRLMFLKRWAMTACWTTKAGTLQEDPSKPKPCADNQHCQGSEKQGVEHIATGPTFEQCWHGPHCSCSYWQEGSCLGRVLERVKLVIACGGDLKKSPPIARRSGVQSSRCL